MDSTAKVLRHYPVDDRRYVDLILDSIKEGLYPFSAYHIKVLVNENHENLIDYRSKRVDMLISLRSGKRFFHSEVIKSELLLIDPDQAFYEIADNVVRYFRYSRPRQEIGPLVELGEN